MAGEPPARVPNQELAALLEQVADLLEVQAANPFRVRAYRNAALTARKTPEALGEILEQQGRAGLERLPGIGPSIAALLDEYLHTGRLALLDRLEGQVSPEDLFATIPGVGEALAHRLHETLGVETLEELELAAHDGRLESVPGVGPRRARGIREVLAATLSRSSRRRARRRAWVEAQDAAEAPPVAALLDVDAQYRRRATAGELRRVAPRRFNPDGRAWLPILHTERDGWSFTALYSNTARAHRLGTTRDWVVLYYERDGDEDQCTVVTERSGPLHGRRVVRGREAECASYYARADAATSS